MLLQLLLLLLVLPAALAFTARPRLAFCQLELCARQNFVDPDVECESVGGSWSGPFLAAQTTPAAQATPIPTPAPPAISIFQLLASLVSTPATPLAITALVDDLETANKPLAPVLITYFIRQKLAALLRKDVEAYVATASFLSPARLPRSVLPNVQVLTPPPERAPRSPNPTGPTDTASTPDCELPPTTYTDSLLDVALLAVFRRLVQSETGYKSPLPGIKGLVDEGKTFLKLPASEADPTRNHEFVKRCLGALMTPVLPPFFRLFMSGLVPSSARGDPEWLVSLFASLNAALPGQPLPPGKQLGPWFYAPALTSLVTPPALQFLVGPSRANYRQDGQAGGLLVEKCKFLQESGCKGLCLHQCKIPAQDFFSQELGLDLTVEPNFATQECQWSWGQKPLPHQDDPAWPPGCLVGCPTRKRM